jgi:hypothetical protein
MFFIVGLIALAIAAIFGLQLLPEAVQDAHLVVLTVFASPAIATVYGGLEGIVNRLGCQSGPISVPPAMGTFLRRHKLIHESLSVCK